MSYNRKYIAFDFIRNIAAKLFLWKLISPEQKISVDDAFKTPFYTPTFFIRAGLFIFTLILINAALGIIALGVSDLLDNETTVGVLLILFSCLILWLLEFFIKKRNHYRSGIDDCLLYTSVVFLIAGIILIFRIYNEVQICLVVLPIFFLATWRYSDSLTAVFEFVAIYTLLFFILREYELGKMLMPFIFMTISAIAFVIFSYFLRNDTNYYYERPLGVLKVCSLLLFYFSMNYFIVREGNLLLNGYQDTGTFYEIPLAWMFLVFTIVIPIIYIIFGVLRKDRLLLWTGLLILVLTVLTIRYRFQILPIQYPLTFGGLLLITFSWFFIRKLKSADRGYTFEADDTFQSENLFNAEALMVSQTIGSTNQHPESSGFGGGKFGGGGAGSTL